MTLFKMVSLFFGILTFAIMGAFLVIHFYSSEQVSYYTKIGTKEIPMQFQVIYFAGLVSSGLLIIHLFCFIVSSCSQSQFGNN